MIARSTTLALLLALPIARTSGAGDEAEAERLRAALSDNHALGADFWIYNDIAAGFEEARRTGKPLFVTFRCVPCEDCAGFDAEVAQGSEVIEELARRHFVPVRQVEMKGVDLSQFQFDFDLNWAAMFLNADGTVYARYGTQGAAGADAYNSIEGLAATIARVLELHEGYPANAAELAGKRGAKRPYKTAIEMPFLQNKEKLAGPTARNNCIHCHNIHDAENARFQAESPDSLEFLWRYPLPENVGLEIDPLDGRTIAAVRPGSPAAEAGLEVGEAVTHVEGQAIASIADIQWALHHLPGGATTARFVGSGSGPVELDLPEGWRRSDVSWRGSIWSVSPRLNVWAPELPEEDRDGLGLPEGRSPLLVRWINRGQPGGRAAYESGLREGDVIVAMDGEPLAGLTAPRFMTRIKLNYRAGEELPLSILRDGEPREIRVRLVD